MPLCFHQTDSDLYLKATKFNQPKRFFAINFPANGEFEASEHPILVFNLALTAFYQKNFVVAQKRLEQVRSQAGRHHKKYIEHSSS